MLYNDFKGLKLSTLGFGAMRLPVIDADDAKIDEEQTFQMVDYAIEHGINYFDTAWGYHGVNSERVMGEALARYDRGSYYLATKFPGYDVSNFGKVEQVFEEQLHRCGVDYFDFYLIHNVCELNIEQYLDDARYSTVSYLREQVENGRIKHLGFSVHGSFETFSRFMEAYGDFMEFCQVQLNYMDWEFQDAKRKVEVLQQRGMGITVMEPLRGGILITLDEQDTAKLEALRPGCKPVEWAFRWLLGIEGVTTVLSGMSNMAQLQENTALFEEIAPLTAEQNAALQEIGHKLACAKGVPCTACHYCVSHCPMELDIPRLLELYNEHLSRPEGGFIAPMALGALGKDKQPSACIGCGACEAVCPQQIAIPDALADFAQMMHQ